jgi:hypothetical protein
MMASLRDILKDIGDFLVPTGGPGTEVTRSHTWPWAPSVTAGAAGLAAALVIYLYAREQARGPAFSSPCWRAANRLIALVLFMMYGWLLNRHRTDLPDLLLLIDDSQSMTLEDVYEDTGRRQALLQRLDRLGLEGLTRLNLAKLLLLEDDARLLRELQTRYHVKLYQLGGTARASPRDRPAEPARVPGQPVADLASAVADHRSSGDEQPSGQGIARRAGIPARPANRSRPGADRRRHHRGADAERRGRVRAAQRRAVAAGRAGQRPRRRAICGSVTCWWTKAGFCRRSAEFRFPAERLGYEGRQVNVRLKQTRRSQDSGPPSAGRTVRDGRAGRRTAIAAAVASARDGGEFQYAVEVDVLEGEVNLDNNRQTRRVQVRDETLRVLYVQDYPNYDFRFLKNALGRALKRDGREKPSKLTTVLQEADLEYAATDATAERVFPVSREELFAYDVLIFGDVNPSFLSRSVLENIVAFVEERGGGLVVLAGPRHTPLSYRDTPLARLLPIELETAPCRPPTRCWTTRSACSPPG